MDYDYEVLGELSLSVPSCFVSLSRDKRKRYKQTPLEDPDGAWLRNPGGATNFFNVELQIIPLKNNLPQFDFGTVPLKLRLLQVDHQAGLRSASALHGFENSVNLRLLDELPGPVQENDRKGLLQVLGRSSDVISLGLNESVGASFKINDVLSNSYNNCRFSVEFSVDLFRLPPESPLRNMTFKSYFTRPLFIMTKVNTGRKGVTVSIHNKILGLEKEIIDLKSELNVEHVDELEEMRDKLHSVLDIINDHIQSLGFPVKSQSPQVMESNTAKSLSPTAPPSPPNLIPLLNSLDPSDLFKAVASVRKSPAIKRFNFDVMGESNGFGDNADVITSEKLKLYYCVQTRMPIFFVLLKEFLNYFVGKTDEVRKNDFVLAVNARKRIVYDNFMRISGGFQGINNDHLKALKLNLQRNNAEGYSLWCWTPRNIKLALNYLARDSEHESQETGELITLGSLFVFFPLIGHREDGIEKLIDLICYHNAQIATRRNILGLD